ncbi:MAG: hypothetical protein ACREOU_13995 [Candidatus Eiseniibacteriota bacterium]
MTTHRRQPCAIAFLIVLLLLGCLTDARAASKAEEELKAARDRARRASESTAYDEWLGVGRLALDQLPTDGSTPKNAKEAQSRLVEALRHLSPRGHATLAAYRHRPEISEAFVRAVAARGDTSEVRAECRDGLARWGPRLAPELVEAWKKVAPSNVHPLFDGGPMDRRGGGATRPIYRIGFVNPPQADSLEERFRWERAFWAGLGSAVGDRGEDFTQRPHHDRGETVEWATLATVNMSHGAGAIVLAAQGPSLPSTLAVGVALGLPVLLVSGETLPESHRDSTLYPTPYLFSLSASNDVRARLLIDHARSRGVRRITLAIPSGGKVESLATAIEVQAQGLNVERFEYDSGRRDYSPEVRSVVSRGADGLVLLGPAEESAEWLLALAATKTRLVVLGTEELDPAGFHERTRAAAEGAVYVSSEYELSEKERGGLMRGTEWISEEPLYRRYYLAGRAIGACVAQGAYTPGSLRKSLARRSRPSHTLTASLEWSEDIAAVPLYRIERGVAVRIR